MELLERGSAALLLGLVWCMRAGAADWLSSEEYSRVHVVVSENAPAWEQEAADVFQKYWKEATGQESVRTSAPSTGVNVCVGRTALPGALLSPLKLDQLGPDGVRIRTVTEGGSKYLILVGEGERGTVNAVYDFLERYLGVRWLAPESTHVPPAPASLPEIDYAYTPPFQHRDSNYLGLQGDFAKAHKLSRNPSFGLFVHTSYTLVPPDKYKDHPEYFAEINGTRRCPAGIEIKWPDLGDAIDKVGQLCWTNPDLPKVIFDELAQLIRKNPEHKIWSVSQMDFGNNCKCDACRAVDEREGTPAGSLLVGVNAVADLLAKDFPGYYIETLAYTYTRKAPKTLKPHDNVIIRLCSIECDFSKALDDPDASRNVLFAQDIRDWSQIAKTLYIWDYTPDFRYFQAPHPNFHVLQPNLKFFAEHKVKGMFEQGCPTPGGEFAALRRYIIAECLWNPELDAKALRDEFIDLYYADAAPYIKTYIELLTKRVLDSGLAMSCFDEMQWIDADTIRQSRELFAKAFAAAKTDEVRTRLVEASIPLELASIACGPEIKIADNTFTLLRPPCMDLEQYIYLCKSFGIVEPYEAKDFNAFRSVLGGMTPPRVQTSALEKLENERYELWVLPELQGTVARFLDKANRLELLRAYQNFGHGPGTWQDWTMTPGVLEHAAVQSYKVVEQTPNSLILEGSTPEGLLVRRRMELAPGSDRVVVTLTLKNATDKPISALAKIHPEFAMQEGGMPQIWTGGASGWTWVNKEHDPRLAAFGDYIDRGDRTAMAYYMPGKDLSLVCDFKPDSVGSILYFFNAEPASSQVNLEVLPVRDPLAPGAERSIEASYRVVNKAPEHM